jgi:hypothetical protein
MAFMPASLTLAGTPKPAGPLFQSANLVTYLDRPRPSSIPKKMGSPLGTGSPFSDASVVFTPARGVIHPSFPLRSRWSTIRLNRKQAPSPSPAIQGSLSTVRRSRVPLCTERTNQIQPPDLYKVLIFHELAQRDCKSRVPKSTSIPNLKASQPPFPVRS